MSSCPREQSSMVKDGRRNERAKLPTKFQSGNIRARNREDEASSGLRMLKRIEMEASTRAMALRVETKLLRRTETVVRTIELNPSLESFKKQRV